MGRVIMVPRRPISGSFLPVEWVETVENDGTSISVPADIGAGELLTFFNLAEDIGAALPANVVPSGFTQLITSTFDNMRCTISYKLTTGLEGGDTLTGMNGLVVRAIIMHRYRGGKPASSLFASTASGQGTGGTPSGQTISGLGETPPMVQFALYAGSFAGNIPDPANFSPGAEAFLEQAASGLLRVKNEVFNEPPVNTSVSMNDEGPAQVMQSAFIRLVE
jgi:hypothetical protein